MGDIWECNIFAKASVRSSKGVLIAENPLYHAYHHDDS